MLCHFSSETAELGISGSAAGRGLPILPAVICLKGHRCRLSGGVRFWWARKATGEAEWLRGQGLPGHLQGAKGSRVEANPFRGGAEGHGRVASAVAAEQ